MEKDGTLCWGAQEYYNPSPGLSFAVIMLNEALDKTNVHYVSSLWQKASVRVCTDGATNYYHKLMRCEDKASATTDCVEPSSSVISHTETSVSEMSLSPSNPLPDIITGDFDSVKPELLKLYGSLGVNIVSTPDQDETDFTKSVRVLEKHVEEKKLKVGTLISVPVVVLSRGSIFWLLSIGDHTIQVADDVFDPKWSWCGLIPLGQPSTVSTTGLKWNLDNQVLAFGHLVSTSNTYDPTCHGKVTIKTSQPLLWTMGWNYEKFSGNSSSRNFAGNNPVHKCT
ncbi:thiamine pyrophosphokinase 1-like isoform X2 [Panulirus ornatus]|uniref:thiamine pyrophosphokinase 1-like isoform X2 n=1 Tax=Panulirus ornatus TaxID=150431 RepID=UPI003A853DA5